jgi:hypothetical protein
MSNTRFVLFRQVGKSRNDRVAAVTYQATFWQGVTSFKNFIARVWSLFHEMNSRITAELTRRREFIQASPDQ